MQEIGEDNRQMVVRSLLEMNQQNGKESGNTWQGLSSLCELPPVGKDLGGNIVLDLNRGEMEKGDEVDSLFEPKMMEQAQQEWSNIGDLNGLESPGRKLNWTEDQYNYDLGQFLRGRYVGPIKEASGDSDQTWRADDLIVDPETWTEHWLASELLGLHQQNQQHQDTNETYIMEDNPPAQDEQHKAEASRINDEVGENTEEDQSGTTATDEETKLWEEAMPAREREKRREVMRGKRKAKLQREKKSKKEKKDLGEIERRRNLGIIIRENGEAEREGDCLQQREMELEDRNGENGKNGDTGKGRKRKIEMEKEAESKKKRKVTARGMFSGVSDKDRKQLELGLYFDLLEIKQVIWGEVGTVVELETVLNDGGAGEHRGDCPSQEYEQGDKLEEGDGKDNNTEAASKEGLSVVDPNQPPKQP